MLIKAAVAAPRHCRQGVSARYLGIGQPCCGVMQSVLIGGSVRFSSNRTLLYTTMCRKARPKRAVPREHPFRQAHKPGRGSSLPTETQRCSEGSSLTNSELLRSNGIYQKRIQRCRSNNNLVIALTIPSSSHQFTMLSPSERDYFIVPALLWHSKSRPARENM